MNNSDEAPLTDVGDLDLTEVDQVLASSKTTVGGEAFQFRVIRELGRQCEPPLTEPVTMVVDSADRILVLDRASGDEYHIVRFNAQGDSDGVVARIAHSSRDGLQYPTSMSVNGNGELFFADGDAGAILKFSPDGRWLESFRSAGADGGQFDSPRDVDQDASGRLFIADSYNDRVVRLSASGDLEESWSEFDNPFAAESDDSLYEPCSVCVGSDGILYVADYNNQRVLAFEGRTLVGQWSGSGLFEFPSEVRLSRDGKSLFIGDRGNMRVRRFVLGRGLQNESTCTGTFSLSREGDGAILGGGDIDLLSCGHVTLVNPRRQSVVVLDFLES